MLINIALYLRAIHKLLNAFLFQIGIDLLGQSLSNRAINPTLPLPYTTNNGCSSLKYDGSPSWTRITYHAYFNFALLKSTSS